MANRSGDAQWGILPNGCSRRGRALKSGPAWRRPDIGAPNEKDITQTTVRQRPNQVGRKHPPQTALEGWKKGAASTA